MKPISESPSIDRTALRKQLYELRREGFEGVDLAKIADLMTIAARLATTESNQRRQLEVSLKRAIGTLKTSNQKVALLWFGLHEDARGKDKDERTKLAAEARFVGIDAFKAHVQRQEIIDPIGVALLDRYSRESKSDIEPESTQPQLESEAARRLEPSRERWLYRTIWRSLGNRMKTLGTLVLLLLITAMCFFGLQLLLRAAINLGAIDAHSEVPPVGTVVDAANGEVVDNPDRHASQQLIWLQEGNEFRACDLGLTPKNRCLFTQEAVNIATKPNHLLWLGLRLRSDGEVPIPLASIVVTHHPQSTSSDELEAIIEWRSTKGGKFAQTPSHIREKMKVVLPGFEGNTQLLYIPGSTELRGPSWHDFIAHLPDGIMEDGISLADIGPPITCFECGDKYKRYVFFEVKVKGMPYE